VWLATCRQTVRPPALDDEEIQPLAFVDFERGRALLLLGFGFALLVVTLAGWQGLRSLIGLAVGLIIVVGWMVPSTSRVTRRSPSGWSAGSP
jgi:uncharacterized membrane protein